MHSLELPQTLTVSPEWVATQTLTHWLTEAEQQRLRGFASPGRQRDWVAGRLAVKRLAWQEWGIAPLHCTVGTDGLAPCLSVPGMEQINWTLSHSSGWGAASWADTSAEGTAGVDIQEIRQAHPRLAARILGADEHAQHSIWREQLGHDEAILLIWAIKEAAIKARRLPWGRALSSIHVRLAGDGTALVTLPHEPCAFAAHYARNGLFWAARAVRPPSPRPGL
jgi:phosphopantetheinyl transferase